MIINFFPFSFTYLCGAKNKYLKHIYVKRNIHND